MTGRMQARIPDQSGRTAVVTGASGGIGLEAAAVLAENGARVILAVRDQRRGDQARARILERHPGADASVSIVDMADLASIQAFARRLHDEAGRIDILLNNAGLGLQRRRAVTTDGFERQFGTNHLGHFAMTGLLMPMLLAAPAPRVVAISSIAHRRATIDFDDLQGARRYDPGKAYGQSKLANLVFAIELDRRARAAGSRLVSVAAHPGIAATGFIAATGMPAPLARIAGLVIGVFGQDAAAGARPGIYAATMHDVHGGQYWGPDGLLEIRGAPRLAAIGKQAKDPQTGRRLWEVSEQLTDVHYPPLA